MSKLGRLLLTQQYGENHPAIVSNQCDISAGRKSSDTTLRTTIRYVPAPSAAGNKPQPRQRRDRKRHCHRRASSPFIRPLVDSSVLGTGRSGPDVTNGGRSLTSRCRRRSDGSIDRRARTAASGRAGRRNPTSRSSRSLKLPSVAGRRYRRGGKFRRAIVSGYDGGVDYDA